VTTTIKLSSPKQLGPAIRRLGKSMDRAAVRALRNAARYGATQAVAVSAKTVPRPRARGTFERSFIVTKLPNGAVLSNAAKHSLFVEVGRKPGLNPPVKSIIAWMQAKKIDRAPRGRRMRRLSAWRIRSIAYVISRKIGKRGFKGRYVLKRTMPKIAKRLLIELSIEFRREFERASRVR
jgi:hypothetical protein